MRGRLFSVVYMFLLTLLFTSAVSAVKFVNEERIRVNEQTKLKGVLLHALNITVPEGPSRRESILEVFERRVRTAPADGRTVYVGLDEAGEAVIGYAMAVGGPGFWGPIEAMVAVNTTATEVVGVTFYRHTETPGLGARMTEIWFTEQFRGLRIDRDDVEEPFFRLLQPGTASGAGELDAITGATQTSQAVERFLNRELELLVDAVTADLTGGG